MSVGGSMGAIMVGMIAAFVTLMTVVIAIEGVTREPAMLLVLLFAVPCNYIAWGFFRRMLELESSAAPPRRRDTTEPQCHRCHCWNCMNEQARKA